MAVNSDEGVRREPPGREACLAARRFIHKHRMQMQEIGEYLVSMIHSAETEEKKQFFVTQGAIFAEWRSALRNLAYKEEVHMDELQESMPLLEWLSKDRHNLIQVKTDPAQKNTTGSNQHSSLSYGVQMNIRERDEMLNMRTEMAEIITALVYRGRDNYGDQSKGLH